MIYATKLTLLILAFALCPAVSSVAQDDKDMIPTPWDSDFDGDGLTRYEVEDLPEALVEIKNTTTMVEGVPVEIAVARFYLKGQLAMAGTLTPSPDEPSAYLCYDPAQKVKMLFKYVKAKKHWINIVLGMGGQHKITTLIVIDDDDEKGNG